LTLLAIGPVSNFVQYTGAYGHVYAGTQGYGILRSSTQWRTLTHTLTFSSL